MQMPKPTAMEATCTDPNCEMGRHRLPVGIKQCYLCIDLQKTWEKTDQSTWAGIDAHVKNVHGKSDAEYATFKEKI